MAVDTEWFWGQVVKTAECWLWAGAMNKGYGQIVVGRQSFRAHRIAWEMENGPIPEGAMIRHTCDNAACVRPDHLLPGTNTDNMRDMVERGRSLQGERHPRVKLADDQVAEIRARYIPGVVRQADLAKEYGVRQCHISRLVRGVQR